LAPISAIGPLQGTEPHRETVLPWSADKIEITCFRADRDIELGTQAGMDRRQTGDSLYLMSGCDFIEQDPKSLRTPPTERLGQNSAPAHPPGCKASRLSPKAQPSPTAKQLWQQLHAIVAQPMIASDAGQDGAHISFPDGVVQVVPPSGSIKTT